jgi:hypothetical protein
MLSLTVYVFTAMIVAFALNIALRAAPFMSGESCLCHPLAR